MADAIQTAPAGHLPNGPASGSTRPTPLSAPSPTRADSRLSRALRLGNAAAGPGVGQRPTVAVRLVNILISTVIHNLNAPG